MFSPRDRLTREDDRESSPIETFTSASPRFIARASDFGVLGSERPEGGMPQDISREGEADVEPEDWSPGGTTPVRIGVPPFGAFDLRSPGRPISPSMPFVKQELSGAYPSDPRSPLATSSSPRAPLHRQDSVCSMTSDEGSVLTGRHAPGELSKHDCHDRGWQTKVKVRRESSLRTLKNIGAKAAAVAAVASPSYIAEVVTKNASPNLRSQGQSWNHWTHKYKAFDPRSNVVTTWHLVLLITLCAQCIKLPVDVSFYPVQPERAWTEMVAKSRSLFIVGRLFDTIYLFDIVMNFWTGFLSRADTGIHSDSPRCCPTIFFNMVLCRLRCNCAVGNVFCSWTTDALHKARENAQDDDECSCQSAHQHLCESE